MRRPRLLTDGQDCREDRLFVRPRRAGDDEDPAADRFDVPARDESLQGPLADQLQSLCSWGEPELPTGELRNRSHGRRSCRRGVTLRPLWALWMTWSSE